MNLAYFLFITDAGMLAFCLAVCAVAYIWESIRAQRARMARRLSAPPVRVSIAAPWFGESE